MNIELIRTFNCANYCIGHLYVNGRYVCDTIEDTDRGLSATMPLADIVRTKIKHQTAIPVGTYRLTIDIESPKFKQKSFYLDNCDGKLARLMNVPGFEGILIHCGVNQNSTSGCIIVGYNTIKGRVTNSQQAFLRLYNLLKSARTPISITITRKYKVSI